MASTFTWLDYSEQQRRKMLDVIELFREKDTRDELGIGSVRDAYADLFFPGTSTIQTRARYFLFVPWTYLAFESAKTSSEQIAARSRRRELNLVDSLLASPDSDKDGIIGKVARRNLQRLPSNIYWQGLGVFGIRLFPGSQEQYHRSLDHYYSSGGRRMRNDDGEPVDGAFQLNWHAAIPSAPAGFPDEVSLHLRRSDADYLRERIITRARSTLLAFLADHGHEIEYVLFPWHLSQHFQLPDRIKEQLTHAQNFSEAMHGAALLYNLMLSQKRRNEEWEHNYREQMLDWAAKMKQRHAELTSWDLRRFWNIGLEANPRIPGMTRLFVERWLTLVRNAPTVSALAESEDGRSLIHERERFLKGALARLDNTHALEQYSGAAGTGQLDFRWRQARQILTDIYQGLAQENINA